MSSEVASFLAHQDDYDANMKIEETPQYDDNF